MAGVLIWRWALPLWRSARHRIRVTSFTAEGDSTVSVLMAGSGAPLRADAGQFYHFRFLGGKGWTRARPYSLSAGPDEHHLGITAKVVGVGSAALPALQAGTRVLIEGPYGGLSARARTRRKVSLIGAGVGITPLRALAEALSYLPGEAVRLDRFTGHPLFDSELRDLAAQRGVELLLLPGHRRPRHRRGRGTSRRPFARRKL
jgi:ferredoxin-NADP reductase